jgi:hypothetical protein
VVVIVVTVVVVVAAIVIAAMGYYFNCYKKRSAAGVATPSQDGSMNMTDVYKDRKPKNESFAMREI